MTPKRTHIAWLAFILLTLSVEPAFAHIKHPTEGWYFRGQTFENNDDGRAGKKKAIKDPVNVVWLGGSDKYTPGTVENHLDNLWDQSKIGGSGWRKHDEIFRFCKQDQIMVWRAIPGRDADRTDRHGSTARRRLVCGNQHHIRMWGDYEHDKLMPASHERFQWVVGGIHYDRVPIVANNCPSPNRPCPAIKLGHVPGRSWITARHQMRRALHRLCGERTWKLHRGARGWFQGFWNSGYLARMTLREKSQGCEGSGP